MCRGTTAEGLACDCEAYDPPQDPSVPSKCQECGHGKSRHSPIASTAVQDTKQAVLDAFAARSEKPVSDRLPPKARITDFSTAKDDALKGFRMASDTEGGSRHLQKPKQGFNQGVEHKQDIFLPGSSADAGVKVSD
ncbi:hypothetical protein B0H14DRAFT_2589316 [Mycena olivaceomarginata]|nr:hypothetical protein B0H14DRAFT_2589316 [Mycena olivaceomarginata]